MANPDPQRRETPREIADRVARTFFGAGSDKVARQHAIRQLLIGAVECAVLIPSLFYLRFREVGGLGWGTTVFFVVYCLLAAIGLYFGPRPEYHTPVPLRGDWTDRIGAFWLVSCAFGPFLGWVITSVFPLTAASWRWLYGLRVVLAAGLPLITALPLTRYVRGKATWVALPLLAGITLLPIWSVVTVSQDLWEGPIIRQVQSSGQSELYLKHTEQSLGAAQ
jgi:hypothetical protein